jgi:hypothetical protein
VGPNVTFYFPGFRSGPRHFESQRRQPCICLKLMTSVWSCSCDPLSSFHFLVLSAGAVKPILPSPSSSCQANTLSCGSRSNTVKLFVPGIKLQAASHNSHRYILRALYPCRSLNPKPLISCSCIPKPMFYFPGDLVGPDPSSAPLPSVLYFPGLMRARRLRLHRHRMSSMSRWSCWTRWSLRSSPLPLNYYFQAGGAPSRPWKLFNVVPRKDDGNDNRSKDNKRLYPVHNFMLPRAAAADVPSLFCFFREI